MGNAEDFEKRIGSGLGFLARLAEMQRKYGFFSIIKGLFLVFLAGYVIFFVANPTFLLDRIKELSESEHVEGINRRLETDMRVRPMLKELGMAVGADRTWIVELHNGSSNIGSGLPFLYGSMRLEVTGQGIRNVDEEYSDFSLSKYDLMGGLLVDGYFYGEIEEVKGVDERLYYKLKSNDVSGIAAITLYANEIPMGILGVSFCNGSPMNRAKIDREIRRYSIQITSLLIK